MLGHTSRTRLIPNTSHEKTTGDPSQRTDRLVVIECTLQRPQTTDFRRRARTKPATPKPRAARAKVEGSGTGLYVYTIETTPPVASEEFSTSVKPLFEEAIAGN